MTRSRATAGPTRILSALAVLLASPQVAAHCKLDSPNGGEVLRVGSTYTITWTELASHNVQNWDLYYSTQGSGGPWQPLALDLPPASRSYQWTVDVNLSVPATNVRIRVVQDMLTFSYDDESDGDLTVLPSLATSTPTLTGAGGAHDMAIDAGSEHAGELYAVVGSHTGTTPGQNLLGVHIPLNLDAYFFTTVRSPNLGPLQNTVGVLDGNGRATAQFVLPPGIAPFLVGLQLHHAAVLFTPNGVVTLVTNPIDLRFRG